MFQSSSSVQESMDFTVKEEPFEELYVQSDDVEPTEFIERNDLETCCLCPEGLRMQYQLLEHIQHHHHNDGNLNELIIFCLFNRRKYFSRVQQIRRLEDDFDVLLLPGRP